MFCSVYRLFTSGIPPCRTRYVIGTFSEPPSSFLGVNRKHLNVIGIFPYRQLKYDQQILARLVYLRFIETFPSTACRRHQVNTALQLLLMGTTTISPILPVNIIAPLTGLQYVLLFFPRVFCTCPETTKVDCRNHYYLEWAFLHLYQRCHPPNHPAKRQSTIVASQLSSIYELITSRVNLSELPLRGY